MPTNLPALAEALRAFHDREFEAQQQAVLAVWRLPLSSRVQKGKAIANVELTVPKLKVSEAAREVAVGILKRIGKQPTAESIQRLLLTHLKASPRNDSLVDIQFPRNQSEFKKGDYVLLHKGNPFDDENTYPLTVHSQSNKSITLDASYGLNPSAHIPSSGWTLDAHLPDMRFIFYKALDKLAVAPDVGALADILLHKAPPTFNSAARATALSLVPSLGLNERQQEAFVNAYAAENYYLIQGPPGTGKTWVLAQLAAAFARAGQRVLVISSNHLGINNALVKIRHATGYPHILKVGKADQAEGLGAIPNHEYRPGLDPIDGQAFIIGGTVHALYTSRLANTQFDVVIADEASQLNLVQAAGALLAGTKFVFIGDHQQMPPIITAEHPNPEHRQSIFEYLFKFAPGTMLDTTYRLNAALADFSSHQFYDGRLQSHPSAAARTLQLPTAPTCYADVLDPSQPSIFVDLRHANTKTHERSEAHYIADMIAELLASGVPAAEIAVVAPYRAQGQTIRRRLKKRCPDRLADELARITIDTVERIQGQERDVVFLSLTSGRFDAALQRASFYFMPNRLNVAITRARVKRIVVGSSHLTQASFESPELQQWADSFGHFLNSCHRITHLSPLKKTSRK
jgi:DNA replication ATP-dependent helicase Dna2